MKNFRDKRDSRVRVYGIFPGTHMISFASQISSYTAEYKYFCLYLDIF